MERACGNGGADAGSVTRLVPQLRAGERDAVAALWERYYEPLVRVAAARMNAARCRATGPEDVAQDTILEFAKLVAGEDGEKRFPRLNTRQNVWSVLVCLAARAAFDHNTKVERQAGILGGGSALGDVGPAGFPDAAPPPEFVLAVNELFALLDVPTRPDLSAELQRVARLLMDGHTQTEIAKLMGFSERTVGLRVALVRRIWRESGVVEESA